MKLNHFVSITCCSLIYESVSRTGWFLTSGLHILPFLKEIMTKLWIRMISRRDMNLSFKYFLGLCFILYFFMFQAHPDTLAVCVSLFFFWSALFSSFINQHMQSWPILLWLKDMTLQRRLRQEIMFWFSFSGHGLHIVAFRVKFFNEANRSLVPPLPWEKVYPSYTGSFPSIIHTHAYFAWTLAYMHAWCHVHMHMTPIWADDSKIVSYECLGLELGYGKWWQLSLWK